MSTAVPVELFEQNAQRLIIAKSAQVINNADNTAFYRLSAPPYLCTGTRGIAGPPERRTQTAKNTEERTGRDKQREIKFTCVCFVPLCPINKKCLECQISGRGLNFHEQSLVYGRQIIQFCIMYQNHSQNWVGFDLERIIAPKDVFSQIWSQRIAHGVDLGGEWHSNVDSVLKWGRTVFC